MADNRNFSELTGYVINDPKYGTIFIGEDTDTNRKRQIQITSQSLATLKLFSDGGFELVSSSSATLGDNICSNAKDGLYISGKNIHLDAGTGDITLSARSIRLHSTGEDETLVLRSNGDIEIDAEDNIRMEGSQVALGAKYKMFVGTNGPFMLRGKGGVTIVEPKTKLIPTSVSEVVDIVLAQVFPEYF